MGRGFRIFLLLALSVWYGAILPGHTRGVVQLPGANRAAPQSHCCPRDGQRKSPCEPSKPASNCALCFYMAGLSAPPPPEHGIAPLKPADVLAEVASHDRTITAIALPYHGRAPPFA